MTPKEFHTAAGELRKKMGPKISIFVHMDPDSMWKIEDGVLTAAIQHDWPSGDNLFRVQADDFAALLIAIEVKWASFKDQHDRDSIRKMALAIIRITAEQGHCTDAALRQEFKNGEVERYGADAVKDANAIADKGPFAIVTLGGANGAPDTIEKGATLQ